MLNILSSIPISFSMMISLTEKGLWVLTAARSDTAMPAFPSACFPLVTCAMAGVNANDVLPAVTGWDMTGTEQLAVGERLLTLARLFNIKQGLSDTDDVIPERFYQPKTDGALSDKPLSREQMEKARLYYYSAMGWDEKGVPLPQKVEALYIE